MKLFVLLLPAIVAAIPHGSFKQSCFRIRPSHAVSNSRPIAELFKVSSADCLNYCIISAAKAGDGCGSVVYHKKHSTCQLYGHDGEFSGSAIVPIDGHDFYNRTSYIGACQDTVVPRRGYQKRPRVYSVSGGGANVEFASVQNQVRLHRVATAVPTITTPSTPTTTTTMQPVDMPIPSDIQQAIDAVTDVELTAEEDAYDRDLVHITNPSQTYKCEKDAHIGYFVAFGLKMASRAPTQKLSGVDQSSCVMYCSQNINSTGSPFPCSSVSYNPISEECHLYDKRAKSKRGGASLAIDEQFIFADKFCLNSEKDCSSESPYIVYPHKQMVNKIIAHVPDAQSMVACVAFCVDKQECKAVTYKKGLCILHGVSPASDAKLILPGTEQTFVIENGCQTTSSVARSLLSGEKMEDEINTGNDRFTEGAESLVALSSPDSAEAAVGAIDTAPYSTDGEWQEWTGCQFGSAKHKMRVRQRECAAPDCEDLQVQPC